VFASRVGVSKQLAHKWVTTLPDYRVKPSPASCAKIASALGVDADYILELAGHLAPQTEPTSLDPRLLGLLKQIEEGWLAMDEPSREVATRGARALFALPPTLRRAHQLDRDKSNESEMAA
jgi:transcriptional regulator with XRE-family HTH domain